MDIDVVHETLEEVLNTTSGITCIISQQNDAPVPADPYLDFKVASFKKVGTERGATTVADGQAVKVTYEFIVDIQVHGSGAFTKGTDIANKIELDSIKDLLFASNLIFIEVLNLTDITTFLSEKWDEKTAMSISFRTKETIQDPISTIESVVYDYEVKDATGNVAVSGTNTI